MEEGAGDSLLHGNERPALDRSLAYQSMDSFAINHWLLVECLLCAGPSVSHWSKKHEVPDLRELRWGDGPPNRK